MRKLTVLALVAFTMTPAFAQGGERNDPLRERLDTLGAEIDALIADKSCDSSSQCKYVGVGSRACGGVNSFEIYSTKVTDEKKLQDTVEEFNRLEDEWNVREGVVSICSLEMPPRAVACRANSCVVVESN